MQKEVDACSDELQPVPMDAGNVGSGGEGSAAATAPVLNVDELTRKLHRERAENVRIRGLLKLRDEALQDKDAELESINAELRRTKAELQNLKGQLLRPGQ